MTLSRAGDKAIRRKTDTTETAACLATKSLHYKDVSEIFADNPKKFAEACFVLRWAHDRKTLCRSEAKRVIGRAIRRLREETAAALVHSGLSKKKGRIALQNACATCETCWTFWPTTPQHTRHAAVHNRMDRPCHADRQLCANTHQSARLQLVEPVRKEYAEQSLSLLCTSSGRWTVRRSADRTRRRYSKLLMRS